MNYFELFGIPVSLKVDALALKTKFYALSRQFHPDFFSDADEATQQDMLEKSSMLNKAFKTFQQQDETIKYVLQLKGLLQEEEKYELDKEFLIEVMEVNEALMEYEMDEDAHQLEIIKQKVQSLQNQIETDVAGILEQYKEGITTEKELLQVKEYYYRKKYLQRILDRMN